MNVYIFITIVGWVVFYLIVIPGLPNEVVAGMWCFSFGVSAMSPNQAMLLILIEPMYAVSYLFVAGLSESFVQMLTQLIIRIYLEFDDNILHAILASSLLSFGMLLLLIPTYFCCWPSDKVILEMSKFTESFKARSLAQSGHVTGKEDNESDS